MPINFVNFRITINEFIVFESTISIEVNLLMKVKKLLIKVEKLSRKVENFSRKVEN